ncbi:hypothetical protein CO670_25545 [Rhizobium sp. J15]|uniref:hypothetical protein n=1 Tax=Rhizobium sp. J15 TaxID=2035450 RepID=UPI000BE8EE84|nr:hypothetical protein [Rhizobium sp. J15]PDT13990.1 hypothetical protein CO670_25545 [Rhizobium sp. J15]
MRRISTILAFCAALVMPIAAAADPLVFTYHGWQVDLSNARGAEPDKEMVAAVKRQLDIVENVNLKPDVLVFMRTIPIWANPAAAAFGPGHYSSKTGIDLRVRSLDPDKPIILHELLHAYHDRMLPGGFGNGDVRQFFSNGRGLWPGDSYMMSNDREFFAVTASVYLYGDIDRPPYSRSQLREKQPKYYQWLAALFDDGRPRS